MLKWKPEWMRWDADVVLLFVAAAVILPPVVDLPDVRDSKETLSRRSVLV
jgi:hypothetical protein